MMKINLEAKQFDINTHQEFSSYCLDIGERFMPEDIETFYELSAFEVAALVENVHDQLFHISLELPVHIMVRHLEWMSDWVIQLDEYRDHSLPGSFPTLNEYPIGELWRHVILTHIFPIMTWYDRNDVIGRPIQKMLEC